ncbi:MAG TPA: phosphatase PAP2 family protein [Gemmatimonadales bacterium]|jgi:undecaprenyl-diphosphatase
MMRRLTHLGGAPATIGIGLALAAWGGDDRRAGIAALLGNALSHLCVQVLKRAVARPRPCDANGAPLAIVELPDPFSFPSGHSAASFAVALPIALVHPLIAPVVLALATLVACSRVALRVHYATDVLAGALLGALGFLAAESLLS